MATNRKKTAHRAATASRTVDRTKDVNVRVAARLWPFVMARAEQLKKSGAWVVEQAIQKDLGLDDRSGIVDTPDLTQGADNGKESHDAGGARGNAAAVAVHPSPADARPDSEVRSDPRGSEAVRHDGAVEQRAGSGPGSGDPFSPGSGDDVQRVDRARGKEVGDGRSTDMLNVPVPRPDEQGRRDGAVPDQPAVAHVAGEVADRDGDRLVRPSQPPEVVNYPKHGVDSGPDPDLGF